MLELKPKKVEKFGGTNTDWRMFSHETEVPNREAIFTMLLIERWGMVTAKSDGEDSAGRAKLTIKPVEECVDRAIEMAEMAFKKMRDKGWLVECGSIEEIEAKLFPDD